MRAMILAAGRGKRMGALTNDMPKPLLRVRQKPLIVYHLEALSRAGIKDIVINLGYLGHCISNALGNGQSFGVNIEYSMEDPILETGGGVTKALPLLGLDPFIVVSSDIFTDYPFEQLPTVPEGLLHLVMVDNPVYHASGDYALIDGHIYKTGDQLLTFGNIGVYHPQLFKGCKADIFPLSMLYEKAIREKAATGEHYKGVWHNVGTQEELVQLQKTDLVNQ